MKKEITKWSTSIEEISMEETVNEFFDGDWNPRDWYDTEDCIVSYIDEFKEISDKEASHLKKEIKKDFDKRVSKLKQTEIIQLKDRKSILNLIENTWDDCPDDGEVGYLLSAEEILDLVLQNGNK